MKTFGVMRTPNTPALLIFHSILLDKRPLSRALAARTTPVTETICESLWIVFWLPSDRLRAARMLHRAARIFRQPNVDTSQHSYVDGPSQKHVLAEVPAAVPARLPSLTSSRYCNSVCDDLVAVADETAAQG